MNKPTVCQSGTLSYWVWHAGSPRLGAAHKPHFRFLGLGVVSNWATIPFFRRLGWHFWLTACLRGTMNPQHQRRTWHGRPPRLGAARPTVDVKALAHRVVDAAR